MYYQKLGKSFYGEIHSILVLLLNQNFLSFLIRITGFYGEI